MWGNIIGGALGLLGAGLGANEASKAAKAAKQNIEDQRAKNQNWYDRRYNEDATQRADAQRMLTKTVEMMKARTKAAEGAAAIAGGTGESVAATKAANAQAMADAASQIAARGEARKDAIEQQYMAKEQGFNNQLANLELQRANAIAQAAGGFGSAATTAGMGVDEWLLNK